MAIAKLIVEASGGIVSACYSGKEPFWWAHQPLLTQHNSSSLQ
jgi:hypothetical protein